MEPSNGEKKGRTQTSVETLYDRADTTTIDEEGNETVTTVDTYGRPIRRTVYKGTLGYSTTGNTYDGLGRLLSTWVEDPAVQVHPNTTTSITYDSLGRKISMTDPDSGTWTYAYDESGNLLFQNDPHPNQSTYYCYDALGRVTKKIDATIDVFFDSVCDSITPADVEYTYDEQTSFDPSTDPTNAGVGRLTSVTDTSGSTSFVYDERGRVTAKRKIIRVGTDERSAVSRFGYDGANRVISTTYPDGEIVYTDYDQTGQPLALRNDANESYVDQVDYDLFGRVTRIEHGNQVVDTRAYYGQPGAASFSKGHRLLEVRTQRSGEAPYLDVAEERGRN